MTLLAVLAALTFAPGRTQINLNQGWEFIRMPPAPGAWSFPDAVPTSAWRVVSVDSQEVDREDGRAKNAFDGDPKTIWHTQWSGRQPGFPHELVIDLGSEVEAAGIRNLPRQTGPQNGRPKDIVIYISESPTNWDSPAVRVQMPNSGRPFEANFKPAKGRYLRAVFLNGQKSEPFLSLSEIGLIRNLDTKARTNWSSQYDISTVDLGDERFDLKGATLERVKDSELIHATAWARV